MERRGTEREGERLSTAEGERQSEGGRKRVSERDR